MWLARSNHYAWVGALVPRPRRSDPFGGPLTRLAAPFISHVWSIRSFFTSCEARDVARPIESLRLGQGTSRPRRARGPRRGAGAIALDRIACWILARQARPRDVGRLAGEPLQSPPIGALHGGAFGNAGALQLGEKGCGHDLRRRGVARHASAHGSGAASRQDHRLGRSVSCCVALYEALFGQRPLTGETARAYLAKVEAGAVTPPATVPGTAEAMPHGELLTDIPGPAPRLAEIARRVQRTTAVWAAPLPRLGRELDVQGQQRPRGGDGVFYAPCLRTRRYRHQRARELPGKLRSCCRNAAGIVGPGGRGPIRAVPAQPGASERVRAQPVGDRAFGDVVQRGDVHSVARITSSLGSIVTLRLGPLSSNAISTPTAFLTKGRGIPRSHRSRLR